MRLNRPQSLHSNTNCPPLPENAGTYLSKPFEHPNTNQISGSNPSILRKFFAKAPSFFLKHGMNGGKQGLFFSQRPYFLSPSCGRCVLHGRSSSRRPNGGHLHCAWRTKKEVRFGRDRGSCLFAARVAPRSRRFLRLFPPRRPTKWRTRRHKKRPRRESTPLMGVFLAAGESRKSSFVLTSRVRPRGLRRSARRPWRQRRCPRRSLHPHHRGRGRRGARVARFRGRAPRERAKKCAFRRR